MTRVAVWPPLLYIFESKPIIIIIHFSVIQNKFELLKNVDKWVPLFCILSVDWVTNHYYRSIKFEFTDIYHCIRKTKIL